MVDLSLLLRVHLPTLSGCSLDDGDWLPGTREGEGGRSLCQRSASSNCRRGNQHTLRIGKKQGLRVLAFRVLRAQRGEERRAGPKSVGLAADCAQGEMGEVTLPKSK